MTKTTAEDLTNHFVALARGRPKRERTRAILLDTAIRLVSARGVDETTVQALTTSSGLSQGTFYNYFNDRDDLIIAAAHEIIDGIQETTMQAVVKEPPGIRRMVLAINGTIEGASRIRTHGVLLSSCMGRFPQLTDHVRPKLRADLRQGLKSGEILVRPSRMLDEQIGALVGLAIRARVFEWKVRNTTRTTAESILRLLGQSPDQAQETVEEALG
ncbi:MAG: TetR/AcrR family transcriptional regulator [Pseudomonadota bacterium]